MQNFNQVFMRSFPFKAHSLNQLCPKNYILMGGYKRSKSKHLFLQQFDYNTHLRSKMHLYKQTT